jgi:hypothetical protein
MPSEKNNDMKVIESNKKVIEFKYSSNTLNNEKDNQIFKFKK